MAVDEQSDLKLVFRSLKGRCHENQFFGLIHTIELKPYNTQGEVTSQSLWSRQNRHFAGITRHNALS